jgi:hypothetical protein
MPQFIEGLGNVIREASPYVHGKDFLDAFLGNRIEKRDETGRFAISPLTGDVELESPGGFKLKASPLQRSVEGSFRFGGPDTSIMGRDPEQALNEALGINPEMQYGPEPMSAGRRLMEQEIGDYLERNPYGYR